MPPSPSGFYLDITGTEVSKVTELKYVHVIGNYTTMKDIFEPLARTSDVRTGNQKFITVFTKPWERSYRVPDILNLHPLTLFV
jgi:hypothetical protein